MFPYVEPTVTACLLVRSQGRHCRRVLLRLRSAACCAWRCLAARGRGRKYELLGQPAPDLVARGLAGENVRLSEHRGEVVVVSFWSGRCNTCRAQLEALDRIAKTYGSAGLTVHRRQSRRQSAPRAEKFARAQAVNFQLLLATAKSTGRDFRVDRLPMIAVRRSRGRAARARTASSSPVTKPGTCASCAHC